MDRLCAALSSARVIAAIGSGGKTTCLKALAHRFLSEGERVVLTTTTKMHREGAETSITTPEQADTWLRTSPLLFLGSPQRDGKIGPPEGALLNALPYLADRLLLEADGSRGLPMKCPAPWEPVLPGGTEHVLLLFGLSALGRPLVQVCHRWDLAAGHFGWAREAPVTPEMAAQLLNECYLRPLERQGTGCTVLLNQRDLATEEAAKALEQALSPTLSLVLSLKDYPLIGTKKT